MTATDRVAVLRNVIAAIRALEACREHQDTIKGICRDIWAIRDSEAGREADPDELTAALDGVGEMLRFMERDDEINNRLVGIGGTLDDIDALDDGRLAEVERRLAAVQS